MATPIINPIPGCLGPAISGPNLGPFAQGGALYVAGFSQWNEAGGLQAGLPSVVSVWRSTDNGTTWAIQDAGNSISLVSLDEAGGLFTFPDARAFSCVRHPVNPELWFVYSDAGSNLRVSVFDMSTNTWTGTSAAGPGLVYPDGLSAYQSTVNIPLGAFNTVTGDMVVMGWDYIPSPAGQTARPLSVTLSGGIGGAWGGATPWPGLPPLVNLVDAYYCANVSQGANGRVHGFMAFLNAGTFEYFHYLMDDGAGAGGAAVEMMPAGLAVADYISNCLVDGNVILAGDDPLGRGVIQAVSVDSPVWLFTALPGSYGVANGYLAFPDVTDPGMVPVARVVAADVTGVYTREFDPATQNFTVAELITATNYFNLSGQQVGSFALAVSVGGAGAAVFSITFAALPGDAPGEALGRKPTLLKPPNYYDCCLDRFRQVVEAGLSRLGRRQSCEMVEMPDGYMMPAEGREWYERASIITPAINPAPGQLVLDFQCPSGYRGLLYGITNLYLGTGFVQGSGDLIWRLQIGNGWVRDMGEMLYMLGAVGQPFPLSDQYLIAPNQRVRMFVQTVNASGLIQVGVARMVMELQGWWMPE